MQGTVPPLLPRRLVNLVIRKGKNLSRSSSMCFLFQNTARIKWPGGAGWTEDGCFPNLSQKKILALLKIFDELKMIRFDTVFLTDCQHFISPGSVLCLQLNFLEMLMLNCLVDAVLSLISFFKCVKCTQVAFCCFFFLLPIWIQSGNKIPFPTRLLRAAEFQFVLAPRARVSTLHRNSALGARTKAE